MATASQIAKLESRIDQLAKMLQPAERPTYHVELCWLQDDGSVLDSAGRPVVDRPGVIKLEFGDGDPRHD
jgi:hypothetical protein